MLGGEGVLSRGGIDILVIEGGGLAPLQGVIQGGGGAPYFRVTRGRIEVNRSRGVGGGIRKKIW